MPHGPIAVVGIACRFPGADSADGFWELLDSGTDPIAEVPRSRWDVDRYFQPGPDPTPGAMYTRWGGFVSDIAAFDAEFFGISPREAAGMDPQQRMLLATTWHALEDAGIRPDSLAGTPAAVLIGMMTHDYGTAKLTQHAVLDAYHGTGADASIAANRISYLLDLTGPSWTVETACSSALVALHQAGRLLLDGEVDLAIVGGSNAILLPEFTVALSQARMLSPTGRCRTFDAAADGYVRSEGCAVVILKRYADALRDADPVYGLVLGSAVNQDGRTDGISAPSGRAQEQVARIALGRAGVDPAAVSYVEMHGTGTPLGDPTEFGAIASVYGAPGDGAVPLTVGSVKSNIGHTEPVSGLAGLIKVLLALRHGRVPGNLHFERRNPGIVLEGTRCELATKATPWPGTDTPRLAAINSFGFGGTNAHVIVQEASPAASVPGTVDVGPRWHLLAISARGEAALRELALRYADLASGPDAPDLAELCIAAGVYREHHPYRAAFYADTVKNLADQLWLFAKGGTGDWHTGFAPRPADRGGAPEGKVALLFTGQGAQYPRMGEELYRRHALFRDTVDRCDEVLSPLLGRSLVDGLYGSEGAAFDLTQTLYAQPALFAVEYAMAAIWRACGVAPDAVLGHSLGENVAACVAGVYGLEDGLRLVYHRARVMQDDAEPGAMYAVTAPPAVIDALVAEFSATRPERAALAAYNSPRDIVVAGDPARLAPFVRRWSDLGDVSVTMLRVNRAFHSPLMAGALDGFAAEAARIGYRTPGIPMVANVSGELGGAEVATPRYWVRHLVEPVRMTQSMTALGELGYRTFVEVGPHPVLTNAGRKTLGDAIWLPSARRGHDAELQFLRALGEWYAGGGDVDWRGFAQTRFGTGLLPDVLATVKPWQLPKYPFQRLRHWFTPSAAGTGSASPHRRPSHPLLGAERDLPGLADRVFESVVSVDAVPFAADHKVFDTAVFPLSGVIELAVAAAAATLPAGTGWTVEGLDIKGALLVPPGTVQAIQTTMTPAQSGARLRWHRRPVDAEDAQWQEYATATVRPAGGGEPADAADAAGPGGAVALAGALEPQRSEDFYERCRRVSLDYGPAFRGMRELLVTGEQAVGRIELPGLDTAPYTLHPAMLDACFHTVLPYLEQAVRNENLALLPVHVESLTVLDRLPNRAMTHLVWHGIQPSGRYRADITIYSAEREPVVLINGMQLALGRREAVLDDTVEPSYYGLHWVPLPPAPRPPADSTAGLPDGAAFLLDITGGDDAGSAPVSGVCEDDLAAALASARAHGGTVRTFILTGSDMRPPAEDPTEYAYRLARHASGLLRMLLADRAADRPEIILVSRGALSVDGLDDGHGQPARLAQSVLTGLSKAVIAEYSSIRCVHIDLDPAGDAVDVDSIVHAARSVAGSAHLAYRRGRYLEARLREHDPAQIPDRPPAARADGSYLITGGTRGIGLACAEWLARRGARSLVLVGRTVRPESAAAIDSLRSAGVQVTVRHADVAIRAELADVVGYIDARLPPLRGVVHAAGGTDDGPFAELDWERYRGVLDPKVRGAWHLHELTRHASLDFFVLVSSASAITAWSGLANYIIGNCYLDALAHHRRRAGLPALSVGFGNWSEIGMVARSGDLTRRVNYLGFTALHPRQGLRALGRLITNGEPQVGVWSVDWAQYLSATRSGLPYTLLADVHTGDAADGGATGATTVDVTELATMNGPEQAEAIQRYLLHQVARVLRLRPEQRAEIESAFGRRNLGHLGFDSLMSVELRNLILTDLSVEVPIRSLIGSATVAETVELIRGALLVRRISARGTEPDPRPETITISL